MMWFQVKSQPQIVLTCFSINLLCLTSFDSSYSRYFIHVANTLAFEIWDKIVQVVKGYRCWKRWSCIVKVCLTILKLLQIILSTTLPYQSYQHSVAYFYKGSFLRNNITCVRLNFPER